MEKRILETPRLILREMTQNDFGSLCKMLQDADVMYAYEHAFADDEAHAWLDNQLARYAKHGFGLWAVVLKQSDEMIGQCGLTIQNCDGSEALEIGYLFQKTFWHQGYATEAATACKKYAFETLGAPKVCSIIRDNNFASIGVAKRNGMSPVGSFVKHYHGVDMPHIIFETRNI